MSTTEFWAGDFGTDYTERNRVAWRTRAAFWSRMMAETRAKDVLEFGCNAGHNLRAIRACSGAEACGLDVNEAALKEARAHGLNVCVHDATQHVAAIGDMTFTAGMLIHVGPEHIDQTMENIAAASRRWVLAIEYESSTECAVEYRGHAGKLWRRPFGRMYEAMGLKIMAQGEAEGFDRCQYTLLEKV